MGGSGANGLMDSPNPSPNEYLSKGLADSMFIKVCGCHQPFKNLSMENIVSFAVILSVVMQSSSGALRDDPKNTCEGYYG